MILPIVKNNEVIAHLDTKRAGSTPLELYLPKAGDFLMLDNSPMRSGVIVKHLLREYDSYGELRSIDIIVE